MRTALIVGAGIGGLSAGIALRQAGWSIRIFERAESPRELGFGLGIGPSAFVALRELGVAEAVASRAFVPRNGELRRMDGTVIKRAEMPDDVAGGPMVVALRPALHGVLLEAVGAEAITLSTEATGFTTGGSRVSLHVRDASGNSTVDGDLLIGADGVNSVIRQQLHPSQPPPRPANIVAVRGAVHGALQHLGGLAGIYYLGPGVESVFVRASETGIYWFLSLARELVPERMDDPAAVIAHMAPRFDSTFRAITSATTELRFDPLFDRDPLPHWGTGAVTLLGDAAHPLLPHTGQGAQQAIVDGVTLGKMLRGDVDVETVLRAYERERKPKAAALLAQGRRTARVMRMMNPVGCYAREVVARLMPIKTFVRIFTRINRRAGTHVRRS